MARATQASPRVAALLAEAQLESFAQRFAEDEIDDSLVDHLTDDDLRDLGLSLGARKRFRRALERMRRDEAAAGPSAERRHLTVVFCDLVGSTQLAQRFDPEDLRRIMGAYLDCAIGVMRRHGGHLAYTQGDGFMTYFGYPQAREDDAARALRAALETVRAVEGLVTPAPERLQVRIGAATGVVVVGAISPDDAAGARDIVVGETPNLAARLQGLAAPGEVIVAADTWALTRGGFRHEPRGAHELKGFSERKAIYRVVAEKTAASRFEARAGRAVQPMLGRERELETLRALWDEARRGEGRLVFVEGPAGIGKSRLARALAETTGIRAFQLQCAPHLASQALHPVVEELRRIIGPDRTAPAARARLEALIARASRLAPADLPLLLDLAGIEPDRDVDLLRRARRTQDLLRRWTGSLCDAGGAALLVIEDVHWADAATQEMLEALAEELDRLPLLLVLTHRPEYSPPPGRLDRGRRIDLSPLDAHQAAALARGVAGARMLPAVLVRRIVDKADGVPLFVEETTKALLEQAPGDGPVGHEALESLRVPATLQDSLMSRLDRMAQAKRVAQLGSVIGRSFTADMIRALAPGDVDVASALDRLIEAELLLAVDGAGSFQFNHALVQDTAYESLLRDARRELHLTLAQAMLNRHPAFGAPAPDVVARHCDLGGLTDEAIAHWTAAGEQALARLANIPAISAFRAALRNIETMPEGAGRDAVELGVQMNLTPACMAIHGWASDQVAVASARAMQLARGLGDGRNLFAATFCRWTNFFVGGRMNGAMEMARALEAMAGTSDAPVPAILAARALAFTHYFRAEFAECERQVERGLALLTPEIDLAMMPTTQSATGPSFLAIKGCLMWQLGRFEESEAARLRAIEESRALGHPPNLVYILGASSMHLPYAGAWEALDAAMQEARRVADEEGFFYLHAMQDIYMGLVQAGTGDVAGGAARVETFMDLVSRAGANFTFPQNQIVLSELLLDAGETERALARLDAVCLPAWERGETLNRSEYRRVRARAFAALGRRDEALVEARRALDHARACGATTLEARALAALAALGAPDPTSTPAPPRSDPLSKGARR